MCTIEHDDAPFFLYIHLSEMTYCINNDALIASSGLWKQPKALNESKFVLINTYKSRQLSTDTYLFIIKSMSRFWQGHLSNAPDAIK